MPSPELERLVEIDQLKRGEPSRTEFEGLQSSGEARLVDEQNINLFLASRFDLAYNAAHALSLD